MHSHVLFKTGRLGKLLVAHVALMGTVLLVHVQHVNAQTVAFVKGAVAQAAWELPVAVIKASCVLEMSVPVVLVRKKFATLLAWET